MARPRRIAPAGFVFHVLNRAVEGLTLFRDQADYLQFYRVLVEGSRRFAPRVVAWSLMPNHWHLVLWPSSDDAVSAFVHWVSTKQSLHYRWWTDTAGRGHVYQDRFQSFPVQTEDYYYNVIAYVEANAAEAELVVRAEDWPWSSLFERVHGGELTVAGPLPVPADWVAQVNVPLPAADLEAVSCCERSGRPYGDALWVADTAVQLSLGHTLRPRGRPPRLQPAGPPKLRLA